MQQNFSQILSDVSYKSQKKQLEIFSQGENLNSYLDIL